VFDDQKIGRYCPIRAKRIAGIPGSTEAPRTVNMCR
jgi:hypothetical protein